MWWYKNSPFGQQIVLFTFVLVLPCMCDDDLTGQVYKRVKFNPGGKKDIQTRFLETGKNDIEKTDNHKKKDIKDKPHIVPLDFIADVPTWDDEFDAEKAGLLLHEYIDKIYKLYPAYKTIGELKREVLFHDPLVEKLNPNYNDDLRSNRFPRRFRKDGKYKNYKVELEKKPGSKFQLDPKEVWEYTKPTEPPESDINFKISDIISQKDAGNFEFYGGLGDNTDDDDDDEDDGDNKNAQVDDHRNKRRLFF